MPQKITERNCAIVLLIMFIALSAWIMSIPYDPMSAVRMRGPPDEPTILTWSGLYLQGKYSVPLEEFIEEKYPAPQSVVVEREGKYFVANEKGPGYCVLLAGFIFLGIESFVVVFLGVITCISTYFLARKLFNWKVAFISTVLVITCTDALLMLQRYGHPDYATMAFAVLGLWLFVESLHTFYGNSENKLLYATALGIAGGVALGFSVTTRYAVVFLLFVPFIYFSAFNYNLLRKSFASFIRSSKILLPYLIGILIPMLLLLNYNATIFGSPFESGYNFEQIITIHPEILNNTTSTRDPVGGWTPLNILENIVQLTPLFFIGMPAILFLPYALFKLRKGKSLALFAPWFLSIFMFYMGIGWVGDDPFLIAHLRYFLPALPGICICAGYAISVLRNRSFTVCVVGMLIFAGVAGAAMQFRELERMGKGPTEPPMHQTGYHLLTISQLLSNPLNFRESFVRVENANIISMEGVDGAVILNVMDNTSPRNLTVAVESASGLSPLSLNDTINVQGLFRQGITNPEEDVNGEWEIFIKAGTNDRVEKV